MTIDEIKAALEAQGLTQADLAKKLGCNAKALNEVLRGARPLTSTMHNHIRLLLREPRAAVLVYRVDVNEAQARELLGANCSANPADRPAAIEAVIHHNLRELIELGKQCEWTPEERRFLGIAADSYPPGEQGGQVAAEDPME